MDEPSWWGRYVMVPVYCRLSQPISLYCMGGGLPVYHIIFFIIYVTNMYIFPAGTFKTFIRDSFIKFWVFLYLPSGFVGCIAPPRSYPEVTLGVHPGFYPGPHPLELIQKLDFES